MLVIEFKKSSSKHYRRAIEVASAIKGFVEATKESDNTISLKPNAINTFINELKELTYIIHKWVGVRATFHDKKIDLFKFIHHCISLRECIFNKFNSLMPDIYCGGNESWGCRYLHYPLRALTGWVKYKGFKFWYNYGHFENEITWKVDKALIERKLIEEIKSKNLEQCQIFLINKILDSLSHLPDYIIIDNVNWIIHYEDEYEKGKLIKVPTNIRHVVHRQKEKKFDTNSTFPDGDKKGEIIN